MIEIYLFVHPLCSDSLISEKTVFDFVENYGSNIQFKFLPLLNLQSFQNFITTHPDVCPNLDTRNALFNAVYSSALDYKAMQLQGKKKGHAFLMALQNEILAASPDKRTHHIYTPELVEKVIRQVNGNLALFKEDRQSDAVKKAFAIDQDIAKEMGITDTGSLVFFNYNYDQEFGISVTENITTDILLELLMITPNEFHQLDDISDAPVTQTVTSHHSDFLTLLQN